MPQEFGVDREMRLYQDVHKEKYSTQEAEEHIDKEVTTCGNIYGDLVLQQSRLTNIDFGAPYLMLRLFLL